jgi:hypothetical protein
MATPKKKAAGKPPTKIKDLVPKKGPTGGVKALNKDEGGPSKGGPSKGGPSKGNPGGPSKGGGGPSSPPPSGGSGG